MKSCGATPLLSARAGPIVTINPTTRSQSARVIIGYLYDRGREHTRSVRARHFDLHHRPRRSGIQTRGALSVLRQNSVRREVVDLPALIRRRSWFDDHPPAPAASPSALSLRWPPPARPRKPRLAPAARRLQANGAPAEAPHD